MTAATLPAFGLVAGLIAGSFLATLVIRWPRDQSVARGRSRCDGCGDALPAWALVPLASYVALRGRCQRCRAAIDWRHPALEFGCALIGMIALAQRPDAAGLAGALFGWVLLALALLDVDHLWLPDRLTLPLAALGLADGALDAPSFQDRVIGMAAGFVVLEGVRLAYRLTRKREGMGQGDPKLFAAIGAWLGWEPLALTLFVAAMLGLLWALAAKARGRALAGDAQLPFGALLACAAWPTWLLHPWT